MVFHAPSFFPLLLPMGALISLSPARSFSFPGFYILYLQSMEGVGRVRENLSILFFSIGFFSLFLSLSVCHPGRRLPCATYPVSFSSTGTLCLELAFVHVWPIMVSRPYRAAMQA